MMRIEVKVPQLPESVAEATLVAWHKKPGDAIKRDENLIDVETDKVVLELPAPGDGVLVETRKADGSSVTSNEVIAIIDTEAKGAAATAAPTKQPAKVAAAPAAAAEPVKTQPAKNEGTKSLAAAASPVTALPAARKILAEQGIDPVDIAGTGRGGRITKGDVLGAAEAKASTPPAVVQAPPQPSAEAKASPPPAVAKVPPAPAIRLPATLGSRPEQRVPMSRLRQRVAERLVQSQATAASLTTFNEVNMQPVLDLRNRYKEKFEKEHGVKLGFMSFFVK
ncbi:MAG: E3 binding domain-containing protein, partial [Betaproteobacteria bacterium]|nr:E3 binding domain-containing protein [Betaproteobacteria bacterium]